MLATLGAVGRIGNASGVSGGAGKKPLYALDFTGGVLDPRLTFNRGTSATYFDATGVMRTVGNDVPRFEYDPLTHVLRGLLMEATATNSLAYSNVFSNAAWALTGVSAAQNVLGLDGTTSAWTITASATGGSFSQAGSFAAPCCFSVYVKAGTAPFVYIQTNASGGGRASWFNLSNGTLGTQNQLLASGANAHANGAITPAGNGWYRISVTNITAASNQVYIGQADADAIRSVTIGRTTFCEYAQVEATNFPTSYIDTAASSVTRGQDRCRMSIASLNNQAGSIECEYLLNAVDNTMTGLFYQVGDGTVNNFFQYTSAATTVNGWLQEFAAGVLKLNGATGQRPLVAGIPMKQATSWDVAGNVQDAFNGVLGTPIATGVPPPTITQINAGCAYTNISQLNGYVRKLNVWNRQLTNTDLVGQTLLGPSLSLNFMQPGTLDPRITFTRASTATYFDVTGTMQTAAANAPRWDYDPGSLQLQGLLLEIASTNGVRNSTDMSAAVPGTPGTFPTNWSANSGGGLTTSIVGSGIESGIAYLDVRYFGTASAAGNTVLIAESSTGTNAATGDVWTGSVYWRIVGGSNAGITNSQIVLREATSGGASIKDTAVTVANPTTAGLSTQRMVATSALSGGATTARIQMRYYSNFNSGAVIDVTIRYGAPQAELLGFATSFIPTTSVAVARAIDSCFIPPANMGWFSQSAGTFATELLYGNMTPALIPRGLEVSDGTTNNNLFWYPDPVSNRVSSAGTKASVVGANIFALAAPTYGVPNKVSMTYTATTRSLCANGGSGPSAIATAADGVAGLTQMNICNRADGTRPLTAWMRKTTYWPRVLSDADLLAATT